MRALAHSWTLLIKYAFCDTKACRPALVFAAKMRENIQYVIEESHIALSAISMSAMGLCVIPFELRRISR